MGFPFRRWRKRSQARIVRPGDNVLRSEKMAPLAKAEIRRPPDKSSGLAANPSLRNAGETLIGTSRTKSLPASQTCLSVSDAIHTLDSTAQYPCKSARDKTH